MIRRVVAEQGPPDELVILIGGVARDPSKPYRYRDGETLRWPGHMEAIQPLVADGTMVRTLRERCSLDPPDDLVVLRIRFRRGSKWERVTMVDRYDPASGMTAMSRTTALTTAVCAQLVAAGLTPPAGVQPLEKVGADARSFAFIRERLAARGVQFEYPPIAETAINIAFRS